jgi:hypothetical protein
MKSKAQTQKFKNLQKVVIQTHEDTKACLEVLKHVRKGISLINTRRDSIPCNKILPKFPI